MPMFRKKPVIIEAQVHHLVDEYGLAGVMECLRTHDDWLDAPSTDAESIIERAWGLLANVSEGDWTRQTAEWEEAVVRWRDEMFHPWLDRTSTPDWPIEDGTADAPPEWQVSVTYTGTTDQIERIVGILGEPESATPATDSDPTSAVASSERASEVVGGGGGAGATTPTRPDPPEGWVVSRDREVVEAASAAGRCRFLAWLDGGYVWGQAWGPSIFDNNLADGRYAVPVDE